MPSLDEQVYDYITDEAIAMASMLNLVVTILFVLTFVLAIGLFFLLLFKRKPNKNLTLFPLNARQDLSDSEAEYFSYIKYNPEINSIVLKQSQVFKKCVVTLILKSKKGLSMKRYNLEYQQGDVFCGIKVDNDVEEYKVVLESVDKNVKKHAPIDNQFKFSILYALIITIVFAVAAFIFVMAMSIFLIDEWIGYSMCYVMILLILIYTAIVIGGFLVFENLSKKGAF